jgi:hypothetical protein
MKIYRERNGSSRIYHVKIAVTGIAFVVLLCIITFSVFSRGRMTAFVLKYDRSSSTRLIAIIIPGMNQSCRSPGYETIGNYYEDAGITPVFVDVDWISYMRAGFQNESSLPSLIKAEFPDSEFYLFGFSLGAVEAFKSARCLKTRQIILCSMSPVFAEDLPYLTFPFNMILSATNRRAPSLSPIIKSGKIQLLYGDHDSAVFNADLIGNRKFYFPESQTVIVPGCGHDISKYAYLKEISKAIPGFGP